MGDRIDGRNLTPALPLINALRASTPCSSRLPHCPFEPHSYDTYAFISSCRYKPGKQRTFCETFQSGPAFDVLRFPGISICSHLLAYGEAEVQIISGSCGHKEIHFCTESSHGRPVSLCGSFPALRIQYTHWMSNSLRAIWHIDPGWKVFTVCYCMFLHCLFVGRKLSWARVL